MKALFFVVGILVCLLGVAILATAILWITTSLPAIGVPFLTITLLVGILLVLLIEGNKKY
ncbi:hypothetical protein PI27_gp067 [Listeria phage WIL-1]|uniref:hypothetical protein n=1 Tax=Listeria phage WIL-1 TaxID=1541821 RepID=UPI00248B6BA0|nr:hypothetical protein PI27_gp067 [Listeria phage WIL-1]